MTVTATDSVMILLIIVGFLIIFSRGIYQIVVLFRKKRAQENSVLRKVAHAILLPMNYYAVFQKRRRENNLPLYFRGFLSLTRLCSKIPFFHFIPKFFVATTSEFLVHFFTGQEVLTGFVFLWSMSFFVVITIVEGRLGELEEEVITTVNKFFLFSVSWLTLSAIVMGLLFWDLVDHFFDNAFWHFIARMALLFNSYLDIGWSFFWSLHPVIIILCFVILVVYIVTSLALSQRLTEKKE